MKKIGDRVNLFNLPLFSSSKQELLDEIRATLDRSSKLSYIFTPNPEQIVQASLDKDFQSILQQATWLIPDGVGLVAASGLMALFKNQVPLKTRIPGVELAADILELAQQQHYRVLLIGGRDYPIGRLPQRDFVWTPGYIVVQQPRPEEEAAIEKVLTEFKPTIVFVAFGAPEQEKWVIRHAELLEKANVKLVMVVGGSFDILFGRLSRAPKVIRAIGGEWLFRLAQQPWRFKRQLRLVQFVNLTLKEVFKQNKN